MDSNEDMPEFIKDVLHDIAEKARIAKAIEEVNEKENDKIETEVLMNLWRDLGDNGVNYWHSMKVCASFVKIQKTVHKELAKPHMKGFSIIVIEALAKISQFQADHLKKERETISKLKGEKGPQSNA